MDKKSLLYAESHEWASITEQDGDRIATVGITDFAVTQLNDLVYLELPEVGRRVEAGEEFGEVESVKAVSSLFSPLSGEVIEVHKEIANDLETLNRDPFEAGWLVKLKLDSPDGSDKLMDYDTYQRQCAEAG